MDIVSKSLVSLEFDVIKEELSKYAKFEQSRALCLDLLPLKDIKGIEKQIRLTSEAKKILDMAKE